MRFLNDMAGVGVPVCLTSGCDVVDPRRIREMRMREQLLSHLSQSFSAGWRAKLVGDHIERVTLSRQTKHGFCKVVAV